LVKTNDVIAASHKRKKGIRHPTYLDTALPL